MSIPGRLTGVSEKPSSQKKSSVSGSSSTTAGHQGKPSRRAHTTEPTVYRTATRRGKDEFGMCSCGAEHQLYLASGGGMVRQCSDFRIRHFQ